MTGMSNGFQDKKSWRRFIHFFLLQFQSARRSQNQNRFQDIIKICPEKRFKA